MTEFADLPEHEATGRIAEIYDEIRVYGAVPYVSSLQRQLATIPGCLEWVWDAVRPHFVDGRLPEAAWATVAGLELPQVASIPRPALAAMGVARDDEPVLDAIYETFLRASPVNMATASAIGHLLDLTPADEYQASAATPRWRPPAQPRALPPFPSSEALGPDGEALLALFNVDMGGARFVPGLYRLLAHWPAYLGHVAAEILPLFEDQRILAACHDIVAGIDAIMPPLTEGLACGPKPFDHETEAALRRSLQTYRGTTSPQMIVFSKILREALPDAP